MPNHYTISQLAEAADIPPTTVRYYERIGLVEPDDRSQGNYRLYGNEFLNKLKFVRAAPAVGFALEEVKSCRLFFVAPDGLCCGIGEPAKRITATSQANMKPHFMSRSEDSRRPVWAADSERSMKIARRFCSSRSQGREEIWTIVTRAYML